MQPCRKDTGEPSRVSAGSSGSTAAGVIGTVPTLGGVTTTGGAQSAGGGTTAGGASATPSSVGSGSPWSGLSITRAASTQAPSASAGTGSGVLSATTMGCGPGRPASGIVCLRDVARVELGDQNYNLGCLFDGHPSVGLVIFQLPGSNALDVANRIRAKMEELKKDFP